METLRWLLSKGWQSIPPDYRVEIFGGIIAGVALGALVVFRQSGLATFKWLVGRFRKPAELPSPSPPPIPIEIKVTTQQPPQIEPAAVDVATYAPFIPPPPTVGFVARRDKEDRDILETLKKSLAPTSSQLVALWGDGGHGKTTLAAEAARALKEDFKERIIWVSAEKSADFIFSTLLDEIAQKLGHNDLLKYLLEPKKAEVQKLLASAPTLVVLDNFETVAPEEQKLCAEFLAQKSPFPALITTRERLTGAKNISLDKMNPSEADELLKRLIADANIEQAVAGLDRSTILQAADWNPLVMEWIVRQMRADEPRAVLNDLEHGKGDAVQRVFDRSFNLRQLGNDGRDTLLALSLFVPSATREALAEVAGLGEDAERLREPARRLVDLGLLRMTAGNERLFVEGLTRQLAQVRLTEDERADQFRRRYVAYFLRYAEVRATPEGYDALEAERDNLLRATDTAFTHGDWESVMQMAYALADPVSGMLSVRGYWDDALRLGEMALKAACSSQTEEQVAGLSHNLAVMYQNRGELLESRRLYNESLEIAKKLGNQGGIASTLHELGRLAQAQGEVDEARRLYNDSLEIKRKLGNQSGIASTLHQLAMLAQAQGDMDEARRLYNESLEIKRKLGDQGGIAGTLHNLAAIAQAQGEVDEARRLYNDSLEINKKLGDQGGIAGTLHQLGRLAEDQGDMDEARRLYNESLEIAKKLGNQGGIASTLHQLAMLAQDQGEVDEARRLYDKSLEIKRKLGNQSGIASSLGQLGLLAEKEGNEAEAARLFREALKIFERLGSPDAEIARRCLKRVEGEPS